MHRNILSGILTKYNATIDGEDMISTVLPANEKATVTAMEFVQEICRYHGIPEDIRADIVLVTDEATNNIVKHAYKEAARGGSNGEPWVSVGVQLTDSGDLYLILKDQGIRFQTGPVKKPDILARVNGAMTGGYGIYLIQALMDRVDYFRQGSENVFIAHKSIYPVVDPSPYRHQRSGKQRNTHPGTDGPGLS